MQERDQTGQQQDGTAEGDRRTYELLSGQMRSVEYFPVDFAELKANIVALECPFDILNGVLNVALRSLIS